MENFSYQSGRVAIIHEDGVIKVTVSGIATLESTPDEFVNFFQLCGKVASRIVRESPIDMGWKLEAEAFTDSGLLSKPDQEG